IFESAFLRRAEISTDGIIRVSEEIHSASGEEMTDYYDLSELMTDEYIVYPTRNLKELRDVDEEKLIIYNIEKLNAVHLKDDE
ncbi:MAG TPA: hypothetical protein VK085_07015, partial [Pseudogracilibacillus sp.]|nr:hypothetical protein [Pseudogracilibacillus sp.]